MCREIVYVKERKIEEIPGFYESVIGSESIPDKNDVSNEESDDSEKSEASNDSDYINTSEGEERLISAKDRLNEYRLRGIKRENVILKSMLICRHCNSRGVESMSLPCAHIVCCDKCADILDNCPLCSERILGTVRIYMA